MSLLNNPKLTNNQRRHQRLPVNFEVELTHAVLGTQILRTRNISDGGVFLATNNPPSLGDLVQVRLRGSLGGNEEPPTLTMKVVRLEDEGCGLEFV